MFYCNYVNLQKFLNCLMFKCFNAMTHQVLSAQIHRHNDDMQFTIYECPNGRFLCCWWLSSDIHNTHIRSYKSYAGALSFFRSTIEIF